MTTPILTSLRELYRVGPGPSSSHTLGPMRAARAFRASAISRLVGVREAKVTVELFGSLSATGRGHGTHLAILAGLLDWDPETCDPDAFRTIEAGYASERSTNWSQATVAWSNDSIQYVPWRESADVALEHPNTIRFRLLELTGTKDDTPQPETHTILEETWLSPGGGSIRRAGEPAPRRRPPPAIPFSDAQTLMAQGASRDLTLGEVVLRNEMAWDEALGLEPIHNTLLRAWKEMVACIQRGLDVEGQLPGGLGMRRRAKALLERCDARAVDPGYEHIARAQAYAFAVNEENAAGGRIVTAPTNGAAGILPAVLFEIRNRMKLRDEVIVRALATAGAIAMLVKTHASLSGAEVGCQGEVGTATAMAAAALCEIQGGSREQVEFAAEIAMEHNLGLTCDPLKGLVQAPCIERNAMGVAKAWSAAQLALHSDGEHVISLDRVIRVMKRTGLDMRREYKETSEGGLAVSLPEC